MWRNVPWTKTMLEDFIKEGLLTEDEEKLIRTRIAGWSIVKQALEFEMSTATVSRHIKKIQNKYEELHKLYPDRFIKLEPSVFEYMLDNEDPEKEHIVRDFFTNFKTHCGKDPRKMKAGEIVKCQQNCPYHDFYIRNTN